MIDCLMYVVCCLLFLFGISPAMNLSVKKFSLQRNDRSTSVFRHA